ncbi:MAG: hypothetical protein LBL24_07785 [Bacteroidales bacterium]|jgi:hypothetical protein|nr:hypothetical protein [Bacteroidales bacterium]
MNYKDKFKQADTEAFTASIARDILEKMDKLRLGANENMKRRWVWELIQNAKDAVQRDLPVEIKIDLSDDKLLFSHNGKCFTANDITFLIRQVSNKDREVSEQEFNHKPTGKFGTGFLTTHLLSEQVEITGVAKEPDLDYRQFVLPLDRSGRTKDEIEQSVNRSVEVRDTLDEKPTYQDFNANDFNTTFSYNLNEEGKQVAEIGINDLRTSLLYTMAFSSMIKSVNIVNQNLVYEVVNREKLNEDIELCKIAIKDNDNSQIIHIVKLAVDNVAIAIEIEYQNERAYIKEFTENLPRLFCDFPLIGTGTFNMPVIINSSDFNPTESRDGIWLTDKDSEPKITQNKRLFLESINLYYKLLDYAVKTQWGNLYNLANTNTPEEREWFSKSWIENSFQKNTRTKLKTLPIVELENGEFVPIKDSEGNNSIYFPHHTKDEVREKIWELEYKLFPDKIPAKRNVHNWDNVLWNDCRKDTLETISKFITNEEKLINLSKLIDNDIDKSISWLNEYYELLDFEEAFIKDSLNSKITSNHSSLYEYAIIPNQNGDFKNPNLLYIDNNIDEELKNVLSILTTDPKTYLLHKQVKRIDKISYGDKNQEVIIEEINKKLEEKDVNGKPDRERGREYLLCLFSQDTSFPKHREELYNYCKQLKIELSEKKYLADWSEAIWKNCDTPQIKRLVKIVSDQKNLAGLTVFLDLESNDKTIEWLNGFIQFVKEQRVIEQLKQKTEPIIPNQNGDFTSYDNLISDCGNLNEDLKDILELLGKSIRKELINNSIFFELPKSAEREPKHFAQEITDLIKPKFSEMPRSESTKEIFKRMYLWINKNEDKAKELFPYLHKNRFKLFDEEEIANLFNKQEDIVNENARLKEENTKLKSKNEELEKLLAEKEQIEKEKIELEAKLKELEQINPDSSEIADIKEAIKRKGDDITVREDVVIAVGYGGGISVKDQIETNREAKQIVKEHLEKEGYNFSKGIEGYSTIDGVIKNNVEYPLVVKSYKYQDAPLKIGANEWMQLMKPNSMFWVHFGNGKLSYLKLFDLLRKQDKLSISFSTENLDYENRLEKFAELLHYFSNVHFDFNSIRSDNYSTADNLNDYSFDERKTEKDLTPDNDSLL